MTVFTIKNWYQLDFQISNKISEIQAVLLNIDEVISELQTQKLAGHWFFLYESDDGNPTIRVRIQSINRGNLKGMLDELASAKGLVVADKHPFSDYQEGSEAMFNETFANAFAEIMSELTKLTIAKMKGEANFESYRALERVHHCMFNNLATLSTKPEEYYLFQRLQERYGFPIDNNFENPRPIANPPE